MKKILLVLIFALLGAVSYSQGGNKLYEKTADKYLVNSIEILKRTFKVGDTLTLLTGSGVKGEFISVRLFASSTEPFPANGIGQKFIILKIYHRSDGLNSFDQLVCEYIKNLHVYIDPLLALTKKEIH